MKKSNLAKSIDVVLKVNDKIIGGQQGADLIRQSSIINITNKINGEWEESLAGSKSWSINFSGVYILNSQGLDLLENAFLNNEKIEVSFSIGNKLYSGKCLIVDFPVSAVFNTQFKYQLELLGTGELVVSNN